MGQYYRLHKKALILTLYIIITFINTSTAVSIDTSHKLSSLGNTDPVTDDMHREFEEVHLKNGKEKSETGEIEFVTDHPT